MKKLFLILIPVLLLVIPNKCEAKYILEKTTKVSVNIQTPVSLTITDINNSIINNNEISEENKAAAVNELAQITEYSEKEIASELLLEAKGFGDVVVSIANGSVDVVVNTTSITDSQRAQIEDIVKRKTGLPASKITINVCNNLNN